MLIQYLDMHKRNDKNITHDSALLVISPVKIYKATLILPLSSVECALCSNIKQIILGIACISETISQKNYSETHHVLSATFLRALDNIVPTKPKSQ